MLADFEQRLAEVLGAALLPPLRGRVVATSGSGQVPVGDEPLVEVSFVRAEPAPGELGAVRPEQVPGQDDLRRVLRLEVGVRAEVVTSVPASERGDRVAAVDQLLYVLDAPEFRRAAALVRAGVDQGFWIQELTVTAGGSLSDDVANRATGVDLLARGWFWPAGAPGQAGQSIKETRVRGAGLDLALTPAAPLLLAGGEPRELQLALLTSGTSVLRRDEPGSPPTISTAPYGSLLVRLERPDGSAGTGVLGGGTDAGNGLHRIVLGQGRAALQYTPPDEAARETLVVAVEADQGIPGLELGRYELQVRES